MTDGERFFLNLIEDGTLSVNKNGEIWRHYWVHPFGGRMKLREPRRAENDSGRYLRLSTFYNGKSIKASAHRVIFIYLYGDIIDGFEIDHIDTNKRNNHPGNLERVTTQENKDRATSMGLGRVRHVVTTPPRRGEDAARAQLTWEQVREIRALAGKISQQELARRYAVTRANISAIITKRSWRED